MFLSAQTRFPFVHADFSWSFGFFFLIWSFGWDYFYQIDATYDVFAAEFRMYFLIYQLQMDVVSEILASMLMVVPLCSSGGLAFISYIWSL